MKSKRFFTVLSALALSLGIAAPTLANDTVFTRFKAGEGNDGALQIKVATYTHPKTKAEVVLYGVVHIADKGYYKNVQKDLDGYNVVLWEGVKPGKKKVKPDSGMAGIGEMQKVMCEILGLTFQKDGINYKRDNFVWSDMNMDQLQEAFGDDASKAMPGAGMFNPEMLKRMGPLMKMGAQFFKFMAKANPDMQKNLKKTFATQLGNADMANAPGMGEKFKEVILLKRNDVVWKDLKAQLETRKEGSIAIFYGAAHMADFDARLLKEGWTQSSNKWMNAWTIGDGAGEGEVETPKATPRPKTGKRWF